MMGSEIEEEEIIELTEVVEEGPAFQAGNKRPVPSPPDPENRPSFLRPPPASDFHSLVPDSAARMSKTVLPEREDNPNPPEGMRLGEREAGEFGPRTGAEPLRAEMEKLKKEIEKYQARVEALSRQAEAWFANEGKPVLEKVAREVFPQMAEKVLRQEIDRLKEESRTPENE